MDYKEKFFTIKDLKSSVYKESDRALLDKVAPRNSVTWRVNATDEDILYLLLDYCSREQIIKNRGTSKSSVIKTSSGEDYSKKKSHLMNLFKKREAKN